MRCLGTLFIFYMDVIICTVLGIYENYLLKQYLVRFPRAL